MAILSCEYLEQEYHNFQIAGQVGPQAYIISWAK
jgi:hypothetical protein